MYHRIPSCPNSDKFSGTGPEISASIPESHSQANERSKHTGATHTPAPPEPVPAVSSSQYIILAINEVQRELNDSDLLVFTAQCTTVSVVKEEYYRNEPIEML